MNLEKFFKSEILVLTLLFFLHLLFLIYAISNLSISFYEAEIFYNQHSLVATLTHIFCKLFGQNDYVIRIPFILLHFINSILLYKISKFILKRRFDRVIAVILYMMLPCVAASAIVVNVAGFIIFFTLLAVLFECKKQNTALYITLFIAFFVDKSFYVLYACLAVYAYYRRRKNLFVINILLFIFCILFYDLGTSGKPKGYFLDTFGVYAGAFSPFLFLFFIYTIYRIWIKESKNLLWFIVSISFCMSLLFSLRQRIPLESILPYCAISAPLMVRVFFNSYRLRLPQFRKIHKFVAIFTLFVLFLSNVAIYFNQAMYPVLFKNRYEKHFIYKFDIAKELAQKLKEHKIYRIKCDDEELALRLKFYGINGGGEWYISNNALEFENFSVEIYRYKALVTKFYVKML